MERKRDMYNKTTKFNSICLVCSQGMGTNDLRFNQLMKYFAAKGWGQVDRSNTSEALHRPTLGQSQIMVKVKL